MNVRKSLGVVYTAFALGAILGGGVAHADIADLRAGEMKKLVIHADPVDLPEAALLTDTDAPVSLDDYNGRWVLLNFWATWCAPCRREMPALDKLQADMPDLTVLPIATGRNAVEGIRRFYDEAEVVHLPIVRDPDSGLARHMGVMALPITVLLNPEGQEVARLIGDADWASPDARVMLDAFMAGQ